MFDDLGPRLSFFFGKFVMMSSAPVNSTGDAKCASQDQFIHSLIVPYNLDSNLY